MVAVDASVLAYALNRFAPEHPRASTVVDELVNGDAPWALPWPAIYEFLNVVTHPHVVVRPLGHADAWGFIERLLASPSARALGPTERHATVLAELLGVESRPQGALMGLETAVILREHGVRELLSSDRAMRRFAFLSVRDPLHGEPWTAGAAPAKRYRVLKRRVPRDSA